MGGACLIMASAIAILSASAPARAQDRPDNAEVLSLFEADQAARLSATPLPPPEREASDATRRDRLRVLMHAGALQTANDFFHAALIFQHGRGDDCLLAHALAVTALEKGHPMAALIAAATLDRYLQDIGRKQIYGTQFMIPFNSDPVTQEPYDRDLLPDAVREAAGATSLAAQEAQRQAYEIGRTPSP